MVSIGQAVKHRLALRRSDTGSALVAAFGVAVVGIAFSILVVSQAVIILNDTARDRVRTVEIHAAEGALDAALYELQGAALQCGSPAFSPLVVGEGTTAVEVTVEYQYFDESGPVTNCVAGMLQGAATHAIITSTAVPVNDAPGVQPQRIIEARVNLIPSESEGVNAAVFAGNRLTTANLFTILPDSPDGKASIWIEGDGQSWSCQSGSMVYGDVIVVRGGASFQQNTCRVRGNMWVRDNFTICCTTSGGHQAVEGNLTVRTGNLTVNNANLKFGRNVSVGGNVGNFHWGTAQVGGNLCANNLASTCSEADFGPNYEAIGLPEVDYHQSAFQSAGYAILGKSDMDQIVIRDTGRTLNWEISGVTDANCSYAGWMFNNPRPKRIDLPTEKSVFNMTGCAVGFADMTIAIYSDTAIFARAFNSTNPIHFISGDGEEHLLALIVPDGGTYENGVAECSMRPAGAAGNTTGANYTPGNYSVSSGMTISPLLTTLIYTPCDVSYHNASTLRGQVFARNVTIHTTNTSIQFTELSVPGVPIGSESTTTSEGYAVEVVYKREVLND